MDLGIEILQGILIRFTYFCVDPLFYFSTKIFLQGVNSALSTYFFGPNREQKLTIEKFLEFQQQLQREILTLEVVS